MYMDRNNLEYNDLLIQLKLLKEKPLKDQVGIIASAVHNTMVTWHRY